MVKNKINDYTFYKIINVNCDVKLCYVGSTVNMKERRRSHKKNCNNPNMQSYNLKVYKTIREHGGWDEFKIIEIGYAEQLTLTEAHVIEEKYRVELNANLNKNKCFRTEHEEQENRSAYRREYAQKNKDKISKQRKVYRQNNIEVLTEREKVYKQNNKEKLVSASRNIIKTIKMHFVKVQGYIVKTIKIMLKHIIWHITKKLRLIVLKKLLAIVVA